MSTQPSPQLCWALGQKLGMGEETQDCARSRGGLKASPAHTATSGTQLTAASNPSGMGHY